MVEKQLSVLRDFIVAWLESLGLSNYWSVTFQSMAALLVIIFFSWLIGKLATLIMRKYVPYLISKTKNKCDDIFLQNKIFVILSYFIFAFVFLWLEVFISSICVRAFIKTITSVYFIALSLILINAILNSFYSIYIKAHGNEKAVIKLYIQVINIICYSLGAIIIIAIFANKNFIDILKGLGAMATILLIVYKDTIVGFVSGIILSSNDMVKIGDWISIPEYHADGNVIDIGLNAVRVQNWDKTITTIPPYKLTSEAFTNWKGMEQSGGRRVKRHIMIDLDTVHFLSKDEIDKFRKFELLKDYIDDKIQEIARDNEGVYEPFNQRRLTNIGTLKKYIENYLLSQDFVNKDMTFIVRQLQSDEKGVPIEIYFFSKIKAWKKYEDIQADVFDHIFAIIPEFNLKIFQVISANSMSRQ